MKREEVRMSELLEHVEHKLGRLCQECGLREWKSHFRAREIKRWAEGEGWWAEREYRLIETTHLTCGGTWTTKQDISRPIVITGV
jgi:hypothetical protein